MGFAEAAVMSKFSSTGVAWEGIDGEGLLAPTSDQHPPHHETRNVPHLCTGGHPLAVCHAVICRALARRAETEAVSSATN